MLQSAPARAAALPAISLVLFGAIVLFTWQRTPVEAVPASASALIAATPELAGLPDDDEEIVDYSFVYPLKTSGATYHARVRNPR